MMRSRSPGPCWEGRSVAETYCLDKSKIEPESPFTVERRGHMTSAGREAARVQQGRLGSAAGMFAAQERPCFKPARGAL